MGHLSAVCGGPPALPAVHADWPHRLRSAMPQRPQPQRLQRGRPCGVPLVVLVSLGLVLPACRAADPPRGAALAEALILTPPAVPARTVPVLPTTPGQPRAADGRPYPLVPADPRALAGLLVQVEAALRDPATPVKYVPTVAYWLEREANR